MANFVGVVTQQSEQTGVTLRARVTSPKGHYTAYQDFRCMVKQIGLTDEQAVMTDLNTVSSKLLANGVTGIKENITGYMPANGENETNIKYTVTGDDISEYFNSDGIVIKRPQYGSNIVVGSLTITVTKNAAVAERVITISIEPYTSEELIQSVIDTITWNKIKGLNATESTEPSTNGMYNVIHPLTLIKSVTSDLTDALVTVTWTVTKDIISEGLLSGSTRIDVSTGAVTRPAYTEIFEARDVTIASSMTDIITSDIESYVPRTYMRVGGLTLQASINIEGIATAENVVEFNLKTLSKPLTNEEVQGYLMDNISALIVKDTTYGGTYSLATVSDTTEKTVYFDTTGANSSTLELFGINTIASATAALSDNLTKTGLKITNVLWTTIDPSTVDSVDPIPNSPTIYSSTPIQQIGDTNSNYIYVLNPTTTPSETMLVFRSEISINGYSGDISKIVLFYRFLLEDRTPATSGSGTGGTGTTTP